MSATRKERLLECKSNNKKAQTIPIATPLALLKPP